MHVLDNPAWHALTGPQETVADRRFGAARYLPDVAVFSAVPDEPVASTWDDLRDLVGPGGLAALFERPADTPATWDELFCIPTLQMVGEHVAPETATGAIVLTAQDVDEMLALVRRTEPGPFARRTIELGDYLGVRDDDGALIAMAGLRMAPPGHHEISAVCTDERARGRGLASALVRDLVGRILDRGDVPLLHVMESNVGAIRVYEALGFTVRRTTGIVGLRPPV